jgi:phosphate transport system permease protein
MSSQAGERLTLTSEHLRRRRWVNRVMEAFATVAALLAVGVLAAVVYTVARQGASALNLDFFLKHEGILGSFVVQRTGISDAIVGSIIIVGCAVLMAVPVGVLAAIYLNEYATPAIRVPLATALDILNGVPAIIIGIFVYVLLVVGHGQSALKASFALAILMLPLIARSTQEVLALVPNSLREASLALGAARWRTTIGIVLPMATGGIITGATLATARVAGETAPLLFTSSLATQQVSTNVTEPLASLPFFIFTASEQADPTLHAQAWGAALVLMAFVLIASVVARAFGLRSRRKLSGIR